VDAGAPGLGARRLAWAAVTEVLKRRAPLDDVLNELARLENLGPRDEALARAISVIVFRRFGTIRRALEERLEKGRPKHERLITLLSIGTAQILFLGVPDHAAVDTAVQLARSERTLKHATGLINAVLRRVAREREAILRESDQDVWRDTPEWLKARWISHYGPETAAAIARSHRHSAAVDLTVKADAPAWAARLGGILLPTGGIRLLERTAIRDLPGYDEGAWWVQDAAASLPARLLGAGPGERIADLCAAPGGKTAQLAATGADVLAIDRSAKRLDRLHENLARLHLSAGTAVLDATTFNALPFDGILLDAPCSATGTIRRHPDVAWTKSDEDVHKLADLQRRLLDAAAGLVKPGGRLVYCSCSLEPEEGEQQAEGFLARHDAFARIPILPGEAGGLAELVTPTGDLRSLPSQLMLDDERRSGFDGFFATRLVRRA
jgi:16S rRNA (cytosine967-C5)-methyltransferase